jgi:hypothetical protein
LVPGVDRHGERRLATLGASAPGVSNAKNTRRRLGPFGGRPRLGLRRTDGHEVTTIEGLGGADGTLSAVQEALRDHHGLQCGFCTPGFVVSLTAFLRDHPRPADREIREALSGNLCRCTGYQGIIAAVRAIAEAH